MIPPVAGAAYPARPGNLVRPLIDGGPAFRRIAAAIAEARHSIWLTVAFYAPDFAFPEGGGLFDALDAAAGRGIDVRVIFWRPNPESAGFGRTFPGDAADHAWLDARGSAVRIRWDRAEGPCCQHQKTWLIDAGQAGETAFVGGINLTADALGEPGHRDGGRHDAYVEITGPSATDVHHNFVQRWNGASERDLPGGSRHAGADMAFPVGVSPACGASLVQIQRMIAPGRYGIAAGERTILTQYRQAIEGAREAIHLEQQSLPVPEVAGWLEAALARGVEVTLLVPGRAEAHARGSVRELGRYPGFMLAGLRAGGAEIYVHAKIMLVDDEWATIGSCNLHRFSLGGHSEMNAAIWDPEVVRELRCRLYAEHLGEATGHLDCRAASLRFREVARGAGGIAYAIDPATHLG